MSYDKQDRGDAGDYAAYFAGMNKSMQQKVALTTAHFPPSGTVADMGSGSGQATFDLASLYPGLEMVGVDVNPKAVEHSAATYRLDNLRYTAGDIADKLFDDGALEGILDSSVLHHVTSFNDFSLARVDTLLDHQVAELAPGGVLIIRDFVVPDGPELVDLDLRQDDGTAALFERFAADFRSSQNRTGGVPFEARPCPRKGFARFRLRLRAAAEFVLRKDYREHWAAELQEEYTYFSQAQFEQAFAKRGLRIVTSVKLFNPWIVAHRFAGQIFLADTDGHALPHPPTNYLIVGERPAANASGVALHETNRRAVSTPKFLRLSWHRHARTGQIYEMCERPNMTIDVLPWFESNGRLYVLAKHGFPRPLTVAEHGSADLLGMTGAGYVTEPIAAIVETGNAASVAHVLKERAGVSAEEIAEIVHAGRYYTSPGGVSERVDAWFARIAPWRDQRPITNYSRFTDSGVVRFVDAGQVLRACHVGGMFDARLELNAYLLLQRLGVRKPGPWIGAELELSDAKAPPAVSADTLLALPKGSAFTALDHGEQRFLELRAGTFVEHDKARQALATASFEYVLPRELSANTVSVLPVRRAGDKVYVGIETRDLPAVQASEGASAILTLPAFRLPRAVRTLEAAEAFAFERLGLAVRNWVALGGRYFTSLGVTPELVHPYAAEVEDDGDLTWTDLRALMPRLSELRDAHLMIALVRAWHALGDPPTPPHT